MSNEINPFEPWRPKPDPGGESTRPRRLPSRADTQAQERDGWEELHQARKLREVMIGFTSFFLIGGIALTVPLGGQHVSRVAATAFLLWLGLFFALIVMRKHQVRTRLLTVAAGVLTAGVAWIFVPTTGGVSLWQAHRELAAVRHLPEDDPAGFLSGAKSRGLAASEFPALKDDFQLAEGAWGQRFWAAEAERIEQLRPEDPLEAMKQLRDVRDILYSTPGFSVVLDSLTEARRKALLSHLDNQNAALMSLVEKGKFAVVHEQALRLGDNLHSEARELGQHERVAQRLRDLRVHAVRRQSEAIRVSLDRLIDRMDYGAVAVEGKRLAEELAPLAEALEMEQEVREPIDVIRKKALSARITSAKKDLEDLLAKHDHVGVATTGRQLTEAMAGEAALVGMEAELLESFRSVRRKALAERLDRAKVEVRELLRKDHYQALGRVGEKSYDELREEAAVVRLEQDVVRFRDSCRAFADLARKAEVKDGK